MTGIKLHYKKNKKITFMDNWPSFQGIFRLWPETLDKAVFENVWMDGCMAIVWTFIWC